MLSPAALRARASGVEGSAQMLELAPASPYTLRVMVECNRDLHRARGLLRPSLTIRWAWLLEGAARWFSGETRYARAAIGRRLRESGRPSFPPGLRDAPLLGGTVIDMLTREQGEQAAAELASRLHPQGPAGSSGTGIRRTSDGAHRGRVAYGSGPAGRRGAVDHL